MIKYNNPMFRKVLMASAIVLFTSACVANNHRNLDGTLKASSENNIRDILNTSLYSAAVEAERVNNYNDAAKYYVSLLEKLEKGSLDDKNNKKLVVGAEADSLVGSYALLKERFVLGLARNLRYAGEAKNALKAISIYEKEIRRAQKNSITTTREVLSEQMALEFAKSSISNKNPDIAITRLEKLIDEGEKGWEVYSVLGVAYDYNNLFEKSTNAYKKSLKIYPDNPDVLNNMGLSLALSGDIYGAIEIFENLVSKIDSQPQYRQNLAILLTLNGDIERASDYAYQDLPHDMATRNAKAYREIMEAVGY
ncbi:MAG: tetratricopeptide repeat protein [Alphaproteobacteria bacterium]|nr:tetratricopeptide repeat protein [Alphaproteobacteria bacterium]